MMEHHRNDVRQEAMKAMRQAHHPTWIGLVSSYDPNTYAVKVRLQPQDVETGWIPVASQWVGNGWGMFSPPPIGGQVIVDFQGGSGEAGMVIGALYSDEDRPLPVPAGEAWLVHQSGSALRFHNDGSVDLVTSAGLNVTVGGDLQATVTGKVTASATEFDLTGAVNVTGDLAVSGKVTAQGDVVGQGTSLHGHTHKLVKAGTDNSGVPN